MKRLLVGLLLLCGTSANAQGTYEFTNFVNLVDGFTTTLLFRNSNVYTDPDIVAFRRLDVHTSESIAAACAASNVTGCEIGGPRSFEYGNLQMNTFEQNETTYIGGGFFGEDSCVGDFCMSRAYLGSNLMFGCPLLSVPNSFQFYTGRSCDADGFTGSWYIDLRFRMTFNMTSAGFAPAALPSFSAGDLSVTFNDLVLGPNAVVVTPEPASVVSIGAGLLVLGVAARTRRR